MIPEVADAVAGGVVDSERRVRIVWHAGEPLACDIKRFRRLLRPFASSACAPLVTHSLQTNATLVTSEWCDLFSEFAIELGVSIDGPEFLSSRRRDWRGRPAFDRAVRGASRLREAGIPFTIIAVVGRSSIQHAAEVYSFARDLGCWLLGINIEESEGPHHADDLQPTAVRQFWRDLYRAWRTQPDVQIREFSRIFRLMRDITRGEESANLGHPEIFPSVATNGDVVFLAPEFVDNTPQFVVGNVLRESLCTILDTAKDTAYVEEYLDGIRRCRSECSYFTVCGGGSASNRYFERGRLNISETQFCKNRVQHLTDMLIEALQEEEEWKST